MMFVELRNLNLLRSKQKLREYVSDDLVLIQSLLVYDDLGFEKMKLVARLREWFAWYMPELENDVEDDDLFVSKVNSISRKDYSGMGGDFSEGAVVQMRSFAGLLVETCNRMSDIRVFIESSFVKSCPNLASIVPPLLGVRLLCLAGGLKGLAFSSSGFIQLLGAKKALFRHLLTGAKGPKHGVLYLHPARVKNKGKFCRVLANKIVVAARVDFFKGVFIGDKLAKELSYVKVEE